MERSAFTVLVVGIILDVMGITMIIFPEIFLRLLNLGPENPAFMIQVSVCLSSLLASTIFSRPSIISRNFFLSLSSAAPSSFLAP